MATLRDFIAECENYEYSKEYFNIMKECAEIKVQQQYIKIQEALADGMFAESTFTEGYLLESCSAEKLAEYKEGVAQKIKDVGAWIWKKLGEIKKAVVTFFKNIFKKDIITNTTLGEDKLKKIREHKFTKEDLNTIYNITDEKVNIIRIKVNGKQAAGFTGAEGVELTPNDLTRLNYAFYICFPVVKVAADRNGAIAINPINLVNNIKALINIVNKGESVSNRIISDCHDAIKKDIEEARKDGFTLDLSDKNFPKFKAAVEELDQLQISKISNNEQMANAPFNTIAEVFGPLNETITATLGLCNDVINVRKQCYDALSKMV